MLWCPLLVLVDISRLIAFRAESSREMSFGVMRAWRGAGHGYAVSVDDFV